MSISSNITGRDGYLIAKALGYAIAAIDSLPPEKQEVSDRNDMAAILLTLLDPGDLNEIVVTVRTHFGKTPDITNWKAEDMGEGQ